MRWSCVQQEVGWAWTTTEEGARCSSTTTEEGARCSSTTTEEGARCSSTTTEEGARCSSTTTEEGARCSSTILKKVLGAPVLRGRQMSVCSTSLVWMKEPVNCVQNVMGSRLVNFVGSS